MRYKDIRLIKRIKFLLNIFANEKTFMKFLKKYNQFTDDHDCTKMKSI